ncbi:hypothetical protein ACHAAC_09745 [Aeromicrobium sp. CF4.19]|uniref:hypothetical protein n=1 Tax=Aeromicrobium sp. CF4.19 TaxID=3373082 RepID=UPI003EE45D1D
MSIYRLDRGHAAVMTGALVIAAAVLAFLGFLLTSALLAVLVVLLLLVAGYVVARPPVVVRLDEHGLRGRRVRVRWLDVENVALEDGALLLRADNGPSHRVGLAPLGRRAQEMVREVYDRMNTAHGYQRWEPGGGGDA